MKSVNLLPKKMRLERANRRRVRAWLTGGGLYLGLIAVISLGAYLVAGSREASAYARSRELQHRAAEYQRTLTSVEAQLRNSRRILESRKALAGQPDFSGLLAALSMVDPDIIFRQVQLRGTGTNPGVRKDVFKVSSSAARRRPDSDREPRNFIISARGVSPSDSGLARLKERLVELGVFDDVDVRQTGRDSAGRDASVSFELVCTILETGGRP